MKNIKITQALIVLFAIIISLPLVSVAKNNIKDKSGKALMKPVKKSTFPGIYTIHSDGRYGCDKGNQICMEIYYRVAVEYDEIIPGLEVKAKIFMENDPEEQNMVTLTNNNLGSIPNFSVNKMSGRENIISTQILDEETNNVYEITFRK